VSTYACVCIVCDRIVSDYTACVNMCVCDYIVCDGSVCMRIIGHSVSVITIVVPIGGQRMVVIRDGSIGTTSVNMNMLDTDLVLVAIWGQKMVVIRDGSIGTTSVNMNVLDTDMVLVKTCVVIFTGIL